MVILSSRQTASVSQRDEDGEILSKNANACSFNIIAITVFQLSQVVIVWVWELFIVFDSSVLPW